MASLPCTDLAGLLPPRKMEKECTGFFTRAGDRVLGPVSAPCLQVTTLLRPRKRSRKLKVWLEHLPTVFLQWCNWVIWSKQLGPWLWYEKGWHWVYSVRRAGDRGPPHTGLTSLGVPWGNVELILMGVWRGKVPLQSSWEPHAEKDLKVYICDTSCCFDRILSLNLKGGAETNVTIKLAN